MTSVRAPGAVLTAATTGGSPTAALLEWRSSRRWTAVVANVVPGASGTRCRLYGQPAQ